MDLVAGAMGKLPFKLMELLKDEYKLQTGVRDKIMSSSRELESMHAALRKVPPDEQVRLWASDVREASYDMEDVLDTFLVRVDGGPQPADADKVKRLFKKMGNIFSLSKGKARHEIAGAIKALSKQLDDVLRGRYTVDNIVAKPAAATSIDPRLSALYTNASLLVGMEGPRDALIEMLSIRDGDVPNMETKIVSLVGLGGLGKTVLDERQLIDEIREFLKNRRYFIVIDDIWDVSSWKTIRYSMVENNLGSKIIITTRNHDVAEKFGSSSYN